MNSLAIYNVFSRLSRGVKSKIWTSKYIARTYYKLKYARKTTLVILGHEGLGDFVAIMPGLKYLCSQHEIVYIATRKIYFDSIGQVSTYPKNLKLIRFFFNKGNYVLPAKKKCLLLSKGFLIKLGHYDFDPIYKYPNFFYTKMGVPDHLMGEKFIFLPSRFEQALKYIPKYPFVYINKKTALLDFGDIDRDFTLKVKFKSPDKVLYEYKGKITEVDVPEKYSLSINLYLAMTANEMFLSDAGFYNVVIRSPGHPKITVTTRKSKILHDEALYPHPFDGKEYILS